MVETRPRLSAAEVRGADRLGAGAALGLVAGIVAVAVPLLALYLAAYAPEVRLTLAAPLWQAEGVLVLIGSVLFVVSLLLYRRGFVALRRVEGEFALASVLCLVGSAGFLLLLVATLAVLGHTSEIVACVQGQPTHALSCLGSAEPFGAYTGVVGFVLGWVGGVGLVVGLLFAGHRFREPAVRAGAFAYLGLLVVVLAPTIALARPYAGVGLLLLAIPVLTVAAPLMVLAGIRARLRWSTEAA